MKGGDRHGQNNRQARTILRFITDFMRNQRVSPLGARDLRGRRPCLNGDGPLPSQRPQGRRPHPYGRQKEPDDLASRRAPFRLEFQSSAWSQPVSRFWPLKTLKGIFPGTETRRCFALRVRGDSHDKCRHSLRRQGRCPPAARQPKTGRSSSRCSMTPPPSSAFAAKRARSGCSPRTLRMSPSTAPIAASSPRQGRLSRVLNCISVEKGSRESTRNIVISEMLRRFIIPNAFIATRIEVARK